MPRMNVFVLLEHGRGLATWQDRYAAGSVYDPTPYNYGVIESDDVHIAFSTDGPDGGAYGFLRKGVLKVTGIDLVHVLRNLRAARAADVIWTHTETEHLGLGLLKGLRLPVPPVIAQSVWLLDRWPQTGRLRRALSLWCLRHNEAPTTLSPVNAEGLSRLLGKHVRFLPYGVLAEPWLELPPLPRGDGPLRLLSLGNDQHRDYETLRELAEAGGVEIEVRLLTRRFGPEYARGLENFTIRRARSVAEIAEGFAWADVLCLPLHPNLHASGITVLLEGAAWSVPCVVTDTGGLDAYFTADEVTYLPEDAPAQRWLEAVRALASAEAAGRQVAAMRAKVASEDYSSAGFARRHLALSHVLLRQR